MPVRKTTPSAGNGKTTFFESWIWYAACSIRGAKDACLYLPLVTDDPEAPVWSIIRKLSDKIGEGVTNHRRAIARFLNRTKSKARQGKVFHFKVSQIFEKGNPKNFIPEAGIQQIADTLIGWQDEENFRRIVEHAELKKNNYHISPSRHIHTSDAGTYRPIAEIVEELKVIEAVARETDKAHAKNLNQLGI